MTNPIQKQETVLEEAQRIVYGDREQTYGHPSKNFDTTAKLWNAYLEGKYPEVPQLDCFDVAMMMTLLKVAREAHQHKRDNIVDACGYLACVGKIKDYEARPILVPDAVAEVIRARSELHADAERVSYVGSR